MYAIVKDKNIIETFINPKKLVINDINIGEADRARLEGLINTKSDAWNQRLTDLSSSMNYRTLGDSATGVRTRKSKARASGQTRFGTGQLNRSTSKLVGINL